MSHVTFYRKYRSHTFDEIIGQTHVVQTLSNAIEHNRLAHAYIFSGPRGTGKTSTARIFSKALNCKVGETNTPCKECSNCRSITAGTSVDVLEIDAASHTGVDHMRELNEQVVFVPVECRYKVYIIDEVHMLSTGAFNALLKTLEEPPKNVIFILATTEPHKIPATVHSRCQHLHFSLLNNAEIMGHLKDVALKESITIEDSSLALITRNSSGCMRDALSLLDQIYSFKGDQIDLADVQMILGATDIQSLSSFLRSFLNGDEESALSSLKAIIDQGGHVHQICSQISECLQSIIYAKHQILGDMDVDDAQRSIYQDLSGLVSLSQLVALLEAYTSLEMAMRYFPNPGLLLQVKTCLFLQEHISPPSGKTERPVETTRPVEPTVVAPISKPAPIATPKPEVPVTVPTQKLDPPVSIEKPVVPVEPVVHSEQETAGGSWESFLKMVQDEKRALYAILNGSRIQSQDESVVTVVLAEEYRFPFFLEKLKEQKNKDWLRLKWHELSNTSSELEFTFSNKPVAPKVGASTSEPVNTESVNVVSVQEEVASSSDSHNTGTKTVNQIVEMFQGTILT